MKYRRVYKVEHGRTYDKDNLMIYIDKRIRKRYRIFFYDTEKGTNYRAVLKFPRQDDFSVQVYNPVYASWGEIYTFRKVQKK